MPTKDTCRQRTKNLPHVQWSGPEEAGACETVSDEELVYHEEARELLRGFGSTGNNFFSSSTGMTRFAPSACW